MIQRRRALVRTCSLAVVAISLLQCTPDLDSLSGGSEGGNVGTGGDLNGGVDALAGASGSTGGGGAAGGGAPNGGAGRAAAGATSGGTAGAASGGASSGAGGAHIIAGAGWGGATHTAGASGEAGEAGSGMTDPCAFGHPDALAYDGFDQGLTGEGFDPVLPSAGPTTSKGSTETAEWSSTVGRTCPGSFLLTAAFKSYSSTTDVATGLIQFPSRDWTGAVALHVWIKIGPTNAPLAGVQPFVMSGPNADRFAGAYDSSRFAYGTWYEMVVPLTPGSQFDPTTVIRVGLQILLKQEGSSGVPATPPTTYAWMDDIWVEKAH